MSGSIFRFRWGEGGGCWEEACGQGKKLHGAGFGGCPCLLALT